MAAVDRGPGAAGAARWTGRIEGIDWTVVAAWLLGFGLVLYLALEGGGYDPVVSGQAGILIWWVAVAGVLAGALPVRRPARLALIALGLLAAFAAWTGLGLLWTESDERTARELARVLTYLGAFGLALLIRGPRAARHMVTAVAAAIAVVALVALASRLQPGWFPEAAETASFLSGARNRLSFPLNYWNGLAELIAIGLPLALYVATSARSPFARAAMGGLIPAIVLAAFFTFSRSGAAAIVIGLIVFLAFSGDRVPKLVALIVSGTGAGILIAVAAGHDALEDGLTGPAGLDQGRELFALTIVVCVAVALAHGALSWWLTERPRPRFLRPSRTESRVAVGVTVLVLAATGLALGGPGAVADGWENFKSVEDPGSGAARLESVAGNGRYQYWSSALDQFSAEPLGGAGAGTFEFWWARNGDIPGFLRDTHSLYFQTLGETGLIGLLLLVAFVGLVIGGGAYRIRHAATERRGQLAAALAGAVSFAVAAGFDWTWQVSVIPIAFLLLAAVLLTAAKARPARGLPWTARIPVAIGGLIALVAIAVPLASTALVRESQSEARAGDLTAALAAARSAADVQPGAASPRLQEALVLELGGNLDAAAAAAREAADREPTNWRHWMVLSRIEAARGRIDPAIESYRRARSLNPRGVLFAR